MAIAVEVDALKYRQILSSGINKAEMVIFKVRRIAAIVVHCDVKWRTAFYRVPKIPSVAIAHPIVRCAPLRRVSKVDVLDQIKIRLINKAQPRVDC